MAHKTPEDIQLLLKKCLDSYIKDDQDVRERQLRTWKQLKLLWEGINKTWYSEVAHDWRIYDNEALSDDTQQAYYDKPVNIFRAYLESIVAALSVTVPPVKCYPDDADNALDLQTSRAGDKISYLLYRHNDVPLLWLHSLFVFCTEGMVACKLDVKSDKSYGTYEKKEYEEVTEEHQYARCPNCGYDLSDEITGELTEKLEQQQDKFGPGPEDVPIQDYVQNGDIYEFCPSCAQQIIPMIVEDNLIVTRLVGVTHEPKSRISMDAFGGLNVKVPNWARKQEDCPYLIYYHETHYANAIAKYGNLDGKKLRDQIKNNRGGVNMEFDEKWARLSPQYNGEYPEDVVTVTQAWLRPCAFNVLDEEDCEELKELYPNGVKVVFVNDLFAEACDEALDDVWTCTYNPMSDYIHFDPLGLLLVSIQELTNDLISLITQTIEHGIGQTFVDPAVVNMESYRQLESVPGGIYEATPKSGKALGESFHEIKTATLSGEVLPFFNQLQSLGQLVSGALPSLFGGAVEGSGTASEYSMSRAQALQRLQNSWKMLTSWWKIIFGKAIPAYIKEVHEDERDVQRTEDGNFINVFIRKAELEGKIGRVELEANENLPITWNQRKDVIMQLLQAGIPEVLQILGTPENLPIIRGAIGLEDFYVPGEDDRERQYEEIKELLDSEPFMQPPPMMNPEMGMEQEEQMGMPPDPAMAQGMGGMPPMEMPSVDIDPDFDDHNIHFAIVKKWVTSEAGRIAKLDNPQGYKNVLLHGRLHLQFIQMQASQGVGAAPNEKPNEDTETPIKGEANVPVSE